MSLQNYYLKKHDKSKLNEQRLFHGTHKDSLENIWKQGFNRSYAGRNATVYGQGVYFAKQSSYSHSYTDLRTGNPVGHMFLARVMVGNFVQGL